MSPIIKVSEIKSVHYFKTASNQICAEIKGENDALANAYADGSTESEAILCALHAAGMDFDAAFDIVTDVMHAIKTGAIAATRCSSMSK
jgi:hypothetical protein